MREKMTANFTMIELMVVVSVIAILASLLLPALKTAKEAANGAQCLSQLRQTIVGGLNYSSDYGDFIPLKGASGAVYITWVQLLCADKYVSRKILLCPSMAANAANPPTSYFFDAYGVYFGNELPPHDDYAKTRFGDCVVVNGNARNIALVKARDAASFAIYADTAMTWDGTYPGRSSWFFNMSQQGGDNNGIYAAHANKKSVAVTYLDGHASMRRPEALVSDSLLHVYTSSTLTKVLRW